MHRMTAYVLGICLLSLTACIDEDRQRGQDRESEQNNAGGMALGGLADTGGTDDAPTAPPTLVDTAGTSATDEPTDPSAGGQPAPPPENTRPPGDECSQDDDCQFSQVQTCRDGRCLDRCGMGIGA